ncbi:hypothetical protein, partial [Polluticaenibacter yanchengensis]|nr:hypothetical protein [Chitinophagaceae bacterium LY-5]
DMSGAYKNIGAIYKGVNFVNGKIDNASPLQNVVHSGDELYIVNGTATNDCMDFANTHKIWAISDDHLTFTNTASPLPKFVFVDKDGVIYNGNNVTVKIVRSGYRNLLDGSVSSVELMENPIKTDGGITKLVINNSSKVLNAGAIEYKQRWLADNSVVGQYSYVPYYCDSIRVKVCKNGNLEQQMNPYTKGLIGNYRANKKYVYYSERNNETVGDRRSAGLFSDFKLMWNFDDSDSKFKQDLSNAKWVWQTESTKFNKRGFELENINALGIYSSALYGYNKILPVATASNTKYNELWYEGFEDGGFKSQVNHTGNEVCNDVSLDLNIEQSNTSSLVNNVSHTGKSSLMVNAGEVLNVPLKFNTQTPNSAAKFNVDGTKTNRYAPYMEGVGFNSQIDPSSGPLNTLNVVNSGLNYKEIYSAFTIHSNYSNPYCSYTGEHKFYVNIENEDCQEYYFRLKTFHEHLQSNSPGTPEINFKLNASIRNLSNVNESPIELTCGEEFWEPWRTNSREPVTDIEYRYVLNKGMYEIILNFDFKLAYLSHTPPVTMNGTYSFDSDLPLPFYINPALHLSCIASEPLKSLTPGVLLNGILEIPKDKRMVISGWVKEDCGN